VTLEIWFLNSTPIHKSGEHELVERRKQRLLNFARQNEDVRAADFRKYKPTYCEGGGQGSHGYPGGWTSGCPC
jgi:hypothetical protein